MMHEREKSDAAVVAVKPTNKAGETAAESVEPRAGTKRNASEQSTHRTLSRVRVTQALDRVRQAARQGKKEKFTALLHHLSIDLLWEAFLALKRDAAPGVDAAHKAKTKPIPAWTLHDLRRSFVTHLSERGFAQPHVVEAIVNHISGAKAGVAGVYNRASYLAEKRQALELWGVRVTALVEGRNSNVVPMRA